MQDAGETSLRTLSANGIRVDDVRRLAQAGQVQVQFIRDAADDTTYVLISAGAALAGPDRRRPARRGPPADHVLAGVPVVAAVLASAGPTANHASRGV